MFLVELVMQGVRGIRDLARLRFQGGFNFVSAGNESGKTSSVDAILRLLFPTNRPGMIDHLISRYAPDASRGALVAYADDGAYYRVIQDFSKRAVNLSKYNASTKDFALLYKDWEGTAQFMSGLTDGISEHEYSRLFVLRREHFTGNGSAAPTAPRPAPARTAVPPPQPGNSGREARLAELREALRRSEEAADADYRFQSGKLKLDDIRKKLDRLNEFEQRAAEMEASIEALRGCEGLPLDLGELLHDHEERQVQKMAKCDELNRDIEELQAQIEAVPHMNLVKDPFFIGGVALGVLSVIAGLFVLSDEQALYFPLGLLLALALIAVAWYKGSQKNTERNALLKEADGLRAELAEIEKSFEQGGAVIENCMKVTGSVTAAELKEKAENYRYFLSLRDDMDAQRVQMLSGASREELQAEYERQEREVNELEQAASAVARYAVDTYSLRQDIERLEGEQSCAASFDLGGGELEPDLVFSTPVASGGPGFTTELAIASRVGGIEIDTLVPAVEAAAQRNLATVTGGKYVRVEVGQGGEPVLHANDDSVVNFSELSHGTKELLYFCMRTGLIEALAGKLRLPFILDDPLAGFDPGRQQAACQVLRTLGTKTQVILFASNPALKSAGDAVAELK